MARLTEEQVLIKDQANDWCREKAPVGALRALRDAGNPAGYDTGLWQEMSGLGWPGLLVPESHGGAGLGYLSFGLLLEALGRHLVASPLLTSSLASASALMSGGSDEQRAAWLPGIADGSCLLTLAANEGARHAPERIQTRAEAVQDGYRLNGAKVAVPEGMSARCFIVPARTSANAEGLDGVTLFLVPADAEGLHRSAVQFMDARGYANVTMTDVHVDETTVLGSPGLGGELLLATLDRAAAGLSAEMFGTACQAFDLTLEYLKTRRQFGQVIGGFQALGHRAAELYSAMELTRSCVDAALTALDEEDAEAPQLCALAKAKAGEFLYDMSNELIQMHGGIGMTDDFDAGLYLKRARMQEALFGNRAYHRDRYARLLNF